MTTTHVRQHTRTNNSSAKAAAILNRYSEMGRQHEIRHGHLNKYKDLRLINKENIGSDAGSTYIYMDELTGKEYSIDQYPKWDRGAGNANYSVGERYGSLIGKTMTLKAAKNMIRNQRLAG